MAIKQLGRPPFLGFLRHINSTSGGISYFEFLKVQDVIQTFTMGCEFFIGFRVRDDLICKFIIND